MSGYPKNHENHEESIENDQKYSTSEKTKRNIKLQGKSMIVEYQQRVANLQRDLAEIESHKFYIINAPNS